MFKTRSLQPRCGFAAVAVLATALACTTASASPIQLVAGTINMFRDTRGANNAGIGAGDLVQYGADVGGGSVGTALSATYPPTGFIDPPAACQPLAVSPNFCGQGFTYNLNRTAQPWNLRFDRAAETPLVVAAPSLAGTEAAVPFPVNVTITGAGLTPTISWTVPGGFVPDAVRINIFDRGAMLANGQADVIHSIVVGGAGSSYAIPATLNSGQHLQLGGDYVFNVQLVDTRADPTNFVSTGNNAHILRRSSSFFNFTPLGGSGPPQAHLPTVVNGVYNFSITNVGPNSVTFIDPIVAIGYDYAIGTGNPNFASVLPPTGIGDNLFDLFLWSGTEFVDSGIDLTGGSQFFFATGGVDRFSLRGIETGARLDPSNVTAFITGLTFIADGSFSGTMTPLVVEISGVPAAGTAWLLLAGLVPLAWRRRR